MKKGILLFALAAAIGCSKAVKEEKAMVNGKPAKDFYGQFVSSSNPGKECQVNKGNWITENVLQGDTRTTRTFVRVVLQSDGNARVNAGDFNLIGGWEVRGTELIIGSNLAASGITFNRTDGIVLRQVGRIPELNWLNTESVVLLPGVASFRCP